ncbi:MAG: hypothetical protein HRU15_18400, partial [Planctomycetes bacterium]|nr:hypothetical protein [Planctomycetota bacterium]
AIDHSGADITGAEDTLHIEFLAETNNHDYSQWVFAKGSAMEEKDIGRFTWSMATDDAHVLHPMMLSFEEKKYDYQCDGRMLQLQMNDRRYEIDLYDLVFCLEE